jgi:hypothetical protein
LQIGYGNGIYAQNTYDNDTKTILWNISGYPFPPVPPTPSSNSSTLDFVYFGA